MRIKLWEAAVEKETGEREQAGESGVQQCCEGLWGDADGAEVPQKV